MPKKPPRKAPPALARPVGRPARTKEPVRKLLSSANYTLREIIETWNWHVRYDEANNEWTTTDLGAVQSARASLNFLLMKLNDAGRLMDQRIREGQRDERRRVGGGGGKKRKALAPARNGAASPRLQAHPETSTISGA